MKITKQQLQQIIKEEIANVHENIGGNLEFEEFQEDDEFVEDAGFSGDQVPEWLNSIAEAAEAIIGDPEGAAVDAERILKAVSKIKDLLGLR
jgi:hypothetical protein